MTAETTGEGRFSPAAPLKIIPVIDVMNGAAVHAVKGLRSEYKPLVSPYLSSADPVHCVSRLQTLFALDLFYVADLDAITGASADSGVIERLLRHTSASFLFDGGYKCSDDARVIDPRVAHVFATETFMDWKKFSPPKDSAVSLDIRNDKLVVAKPVTTAEEVLGAARLCGVKTFIQLRIDMVGTMLLGHNAPSNPAPGETWIAGGGVGSFDDLKELARQGYGAALVSTALHAGALISPQGN